MLVSYHNTTQYHNLDDLVCSDSELETVNTFRQFGMTPWIGNQVIKKPLPIQDSTTQKNRDTQPYLKQDLNPRS